MKAKIRVVSYFLLLAFSLEQVSLAAEIHPGRVNVFQKPAVHVSFSASVASVEDAFMADRKGSFSTLNASRSTLIYLIQDAHTNESGQINLAKSLDILLKEEKDLNSLLKNPSQNVVK